MLLGKNCEFLLNTLALVGMKANTRWCANDLLWLIWKDGICRFKPVARCSEKLLVSNARCQGKSSLKTVMSNLFVAVLRAEKWAVLYRVGYEACAWYLVAFAVFFFLNPPPPPHTFV